MLTKQNYEEEILRKVQALPESDLPKVISMLDKLEAERKKENYQKAIKEALGKYKHVPGSVDDFMKRKEEEKKLDR